MPRSKLRGKGRQRARQDAQTHAPKKYFFGAAAIERANAILFAFSYPDFTVGPGVSPDPAHSALAGCTADRELGVSTLTLPRRHAIELIELYVRLRLANDSFPALNVISNCADDPE